MNRELGIILGLALISVAALSLISAPVAWGTMAGFGAMGNMMGAASTGPGNTEPHENCSEEHHAEMAQHMGNATMPANGGNHAHCGG